MSSLFPLVIPLFSGLRFFFNSSPACSMRTDASNERFMPVPTKIFYFSAPCLHIFSVCTVSPAGLSVSLLSPCLNISQTSFLFIVIHVYVWVTYTTDRRLGCNRVMHVCVLVYRCLCIMLHFCYSCHVVISIDWDVTWYLTFYERLDFMLGWMDR